MTRGILNLYNCFLQMSGFHLAARTPGYPGSKQPGKGTEWKDFDELLSLTVTLMLRMLKSITIMPNT